jgi:hypothetical protein
VPVNYLCPSVRLSCAWSTSRISEKSFYEIYCWTDWLEFVIVFQFGWDWHSNRHFACSHTRIWDHLELKSLNIYHMEKCWQQKWNTHFMQNRIFFPRNCYYFRDKWAKVSERYRILTPCLHFVTWL